MKKFYVSSSFKNIDKVRYVSNHLVEQGYIQTYDWTKNERASSFEDFKEIGNLEKEAVQEAGFVIILLPAGTLFMGFTIKLFAQAQELNQKIRNSQLVPFHYSGQVLFGKSVTSYQLLKGGVENEKRTFSGPFSNFTHYLDLFFVIPVILPNLVTQSIPSSCHHLQHCLQLYF